MISSVSTVRALLVCLLIGFSAQFQLLLLPQSDLSTFSYIGTSIDGNRNK